MRRILLGAWMAVVVVGLSGCAQNEMAGSTGQRSGVFLGDVGITGHGNNLTILRGSRVWKLSIIGNNNTVTVEDGVTLNRIEFWGNGNVVSVPDNLIFRATEVGGNQIIRRPSERRTAEVEAGPFELPEIPPRVERVQPAPAEPMPYEPVRPEPAPQPEPPLK